MKWRFPAKTFLLGEYAAIAGGPAIILTTAPCFELTLSNTEGLGGIHPESPAGLFWNQQGHAGFGLQWYDPYQGRGGMGASSAQFLGAYFANNHLQQNTNNQQPMLDTYLQVAWNGEGVRPSGYDVQAQAQHGCVYIEGPRAQSLIYPWPFSDLAFILLHTGHKLATHHHLQTLELPDQITTLVKIIKSAKLAFDTADSFQIMDAINAYHRALMAMGLVAAHTLEYMKLLQRYPDIWAMKGCGALGADVLLLLIPSNKLKSLTETLAADGCDIIATSNALHQASF